MKAILMSIRSQHLANILNGKKTIELRKKFPSDFRGWVYCYCAKTKPYITQQSKSQFTIRESKDFTNLINGKVVCRFWVDKVDIVIRSGMGYCVKGQDRAYTNQIANQSHLTFDDLQKYFGDKEGKAIHISKLEIFDEPKELGEFYYFKKRLIDCGMDCPPYFDEVKTQVHKAPQSYMYVEVEE